MLLKSIYDELHLVYLTFAKNPNRQYTISNLLDKRDIVYALKARFDFSFISKARDSGDLHWLQAFDKTLTRTLEFIDTQLIDWYRRTMSNFDINIAQKIAPISEAKDVNVRDFLDEVESYHDMLNQNGKTALIAYIFKSKVKGQVKTKIGDLTVETFDHLKTALNSRVRPENTQDKLYRKLVCSSQGKYSLTQYATHLEALTDQMSALFIQSNAVQVEAEKRQVTTTFKMLSLLQFKLGVHDKYKTLLDAAKPTTLGEALATASASSQTDQSSQLNHFRSGPSGSQGGNRKGQNKGKSDQKFKKQKGKFDPKKRKPKRINNIESDDSSESKNE